MVKAVLRSASSGIKLADTFQYQKDVVQENIVLTGTHSDSVRRSGRSVSIIIKRDLQILVAIVSPTAGNTARDFSFNLICAITGIER